MPNWVYNKLTISGAKEDVLTFGKALLGRVKDIVCLHKFIDRDICKDNSSCENYTALYNEAYAKAVKAFQEQKEPKLSVTFNTIVPMPDDCYIDQQSVLQPESKTWDLMKDGWYGWCCKNWGTKWDMCDIKADTLIKQLHKIEQRKTNKTVRIGISFNTAWSMPDPFFHTAAQKYPNVTLRCLAEEEGGQFFNDIVYHGEEVIELLSTDSRVEWTLHNHCDIEDALDALTFCQDVDTLETLSNTPRGFALVRDAIVQLLKYFDINDIREEVAAYFSLEDQEVSEQRVPLFKSMLDCMNRILNTI